MINLTATIFLSLINLGLGAATMLAYEKTPALTMVPAFFCFAGMVCFNGLVYSVIEK